MLEFDIKQFTANNLDILVKAASPWEIIQQLPSIIEEMIATLDQDQFDIKEGIAIHKSAKIESNVTIKAPAIISENCFIAANAYLRGGVYLDSDVSIGPGSEIKTSIILRGSAIAHLNFIGDSIICEGVNVEGGAITANHFNEREDKRISVLLNGEIHITDSIKFGLLAGDGTRIGANSVTSPGTILEKNSIVKRLELVEQVKA